MSNSEEPLLFGLGHKPDPPDPNIYIFGKTGAPLGAAILDEPDLTPFILDVRNQGGTSSCSGNASAAAIELVSGAQGEPRTCSEQFLYAIAREGERPDYKGPFLPDDGAYLQLLFRMAQNRGFVPRELFPFSEANINYRPPPAVCREAYDAKDLVYYQVQEYGAARCEALETGLYQGCAGVIGMGVSRAFQSNKGEVVEEMGNSIGGHAMAVVKIDDKYVYILNSWGKGWGQRGIVRFSRRFFGEAFLTNFYMIRRVPRVALLPPAGSRSSNVFARAGFLRGQEAPLRRPDQLQPHLLRGSVRSGAEALRGPRPDEAPHGNMHGPLQEDRGGGRGLPHRLLLLRQGLRELRSLRALTHSCMEMWDIGYSIPFLSCA